MLLLRGFLRECLSRENERQFIERVKLFEPEITDTRVLSCFLYDRCHPATDRHCGYLGFISRLLCETRRSASSAHRRGGLLKLLLYARHALLYRLFYDENDDADDDDDGCDDDEDDDVSVRRSRDCQTT